MKTGGLPCRFAQCRERFAVRDQASLDSLASAVVLRDAHEIGSHAYHHIVVATEPRWRPGFNPTTVIRQKK